MPRLLNLLQQYDDFTKTINAIRVEVKKFYDNIPKRFPWYTLHDESHVDALVVISDWLLAEDTWETFNKYELFSLAVALMGHDIGMGITSELLSEYCTRHEISFAKEVEDDFVRDQHHLLSEFMMMRILQERQLEPLPRLAEISGQIARSHGEYDLEILPPSVKVGIENEQIDVVFLALVVRIADILHCTADRAPVWLQRKMRVKGESLTHWHRHQSMIGIGYKNETAAIVISVSTDSHIDFDAAKDYYRAVQNELDYCAGVAHRRRLDAARRLRSYKCLLEANVPFLEDTFRFTIDHNAALETLLGKNLYDDNSIVVRELLQNALDACRIRRVKEKGLRGRIEVSFDSVPRILTIRDNGVGMRPVDIKQNLLCACSAGFRGEQGLGGSLIARYGIGFLSCFLIADSISIKTRHHEASEDEGLKVEITGLHRPVRVEKRKALVGTQIHVRLRENQTLTKDEVSKWVIDSTPKTECVFSYDEELLRSEPPTLGGKVSNMSIKYYVRERETENFRLSLRLPVARTIDGSPKFICGLSWQGHSSLAVDELKRRVVEFPFLNKNFSYLGIPLVDNRGKPPTAVYSNYQQCFFSSLFVPFDLDIIRPGTVEMNLARNGFVTCERNDALFHEVDLAGMRVHSEV